MNPTNRRTFIQQTAGTMAAVALMPALESAAALNFAAPMQIALIGAGRQGRDILAELQKFPDGVLEIKTVCDVDERRLSSATRRLRDVASTDDYRVVLADPNIQVVFIATPTHLHRDIAVAALEAGKHVYCEAPLASTVEDAQAIAKAARTADTVFVTGLQNRTNPIYKMARTFVRTDAVRDLITMRGAYHRKTNWRTPSNDPARAKLLNWRLDPDISLGLAGEIGSHQFEACSWFANDYPVSVRGSGGIRLHKDGRDVHDTIECTLRFRNDLQLRYDASIANSHGGRQETFYGSMATVKLAWTAGWMFKEADAPTQGWEVYALRQKFHKDEGIILIAGATKLAEQGKLKEGVTLPHEPLYFAIEEFFKSITGKPVVNTAAVGLRAAVVGIKANEAIRTGQEIEIDHDLFKDE